MKNLRNALVAVALTGAAWAGPANRSPAPVDNPQAEGAHGEQLEKRARTLRAVGIAEALDLDTPEALKLDAAMRPFDERRRPLQKQLHESMKTLRRAANGDAQTQAQAQVDEAIQRVLDARSQMAQVDREMFAALAQGRSAQQKAKLALFLAHFQEEVRGLHAMMKGPGQNRAPDKE